MHDLNSTNGVQIDGKKVNGKCRLNVGEIVTIGETQLVVRK